MAAVKQVKATKHHPAGRVKSVSYPRPRHDLAWTWPCTDYLQLAKYDGKWMILHVLWQSPTETTR